MRRTIPANKAAGAHTDTLPAAPASPDEPVSSPGLFVFSNPAIPARINVAEAPAVTRRGQVQLQRGRDDCFHSLARCARMRRSAAESGRAACAADFKRRMVFSNSVKSESVQVLSTPTSSLFKSRSVISARRSSICFSVLGWSLMRGPHFFPQCFHGAAEKGFDGFQGLSILASNLIE